MKHAKSLTEYIAMRSVPAENGCVEWIGHYVSHVPVICHFGPHRSNVSVRRFLAAPQNRSFVAFPKCGNHKCIREDHIGLARTLRPPVKALPGRGKGCSTTAATAERRQAVIDLLASGMTQSAAARKLGVSQTTVSRWARVVA